MEHRTHEPGPLASDFHGQARVVALEVFAVEGKATGDGRLAHVAVVFSAEPRFGHVTQAERVPFDVEVRSNKVPFELSPLVKV